MNIDSKIVLGLYIPVFISEDPQCKYFGKPGILVGHAYVFDYLGGSYPAFTVQIEGQLVLFEHKSMYKIEPLTMDHVLSEQEKTLVKNSNIFKNP